MADPNTKLLKEMIQRLNSAEVGGKLIPWFSKWKDRAIKSLPKEKVADHG